MLNAIKIYLLSLSSVLMFRARYAWNTDSARLPRFMTVKIDTKILDPSLEQFGCVSTGRENESNHITIISLRRGDTAVQTESTMIFSDKNTAIGHITLDAVSLILLNFSAFFITCAIRYVFVALNDKFNIMMSNE